MTDTREATCAERVHTQLQGRIEQLNSLYNRRDAAQETQDDDTFDEVDEELNNFALCADVRSTLIVQLSTGGPGDQLEIEIERTKYGWDLAETSATYRFLDWFDGATTRTDDDNVMAYLENIVSCMSVEG